MSLNATLGIARMIGAPDRPVRVAGPYGRRITGLAMQADPRGEGFHLVLVSGTQALMALGPYAECDVVAEWRRLAASSGLPLMVRMANGSVLTLVAKIGDVCLGPAQPDYRKNALGPAARASSPAGGRDGCSRHRLRPRILSRAKVAEPEQ